MRAVSGGSRRPQAMGFSPTLMMGSSDPRFGQTDGVPQGVVLWTNIVNNDKIVIIFLVKNYLRLVCWKRECCHFNQCQRNDVADLRLKSPIFLPGWRSGCWKNWKSNFCTWCVWRNLKISKVSWVLADFGACLVGVLAVAWFASIRF